MEGMLDMKQKLGARAGTLQKELQKQSQSVTARESKISEIAMKVNRLETEVKQLKETALKESEKNVTPAVENAPKALLQELKEKVKQLQEEFDTVYHTNKKDKVELKTAFDQLSTQYKELCRVHFLFYSSQPKKIRKINKMLRK